MIKKILTIYLLGVFLFSGYNTLFDSKDKWVNDIFEPGIQWPITVYQKFRSFFGPKIDASSISQWDKSLEELLNSRDEPLETALFSSSVGQVFILDYLEHTSNVSPDDIKTLLSLNESQLIVNYERIFRSPKNVRDNYAYSITAKINHPRLLADSLHTNPTSISRVAQSLDGMDYSDVVEKGKEALNKTLTILKKIENN